MCLVCKNQGSKCYFIYAQKENYFLSVTIKYVYNLSECKSDPFQYFTGSCNRNLQLLSNKSGICFCFCL